MVLGKKKNDGPGSSHIDDVTPSRSTSASTAQVGNQIKKVADGSHGWKFESKLLTLFCIRALAAGYKFEVAKEREDLGGKFDDLIFRYQVSDGTHEGKRWRYRCLQAKHKVDESFRINATHLLEDNDKGEFSLPKYFRSFCEMKTSREDIHDCILCTNSGINLHDFEKKGIKLVPLKPTSQPEDILEFGPEEKQREKTYTVRYKLEFTKDNVLSDIDRLAKQLEVFAVKGGKAKGVLKTYRVALINERVIDLNTKKFHLDFVNEAESLSDEAKQLRQILSKQLKMDKLQKCEFSQYSKLGKTECGRKTGIPQTLKIEDADVNAFLDKFVLVVNMPNEEELEDILQTKDVSKYYPKKECKLQTIRLVKKISEFFKKETKDWITSKDAKNMLLAGVTYVSQQYQEELENEVEFSEVAIQEMAVKLKDLLDSSSTIERITTPSPRHTAVKVISTFPELQREHKASISHLVISSSQLQSKEEAERWKNVLKLPNDSDHFLLVVCDDGDQPLQEHHVAKLGEGETTQRNKVIVISDKKAAIAYHIRDEIKYTQLDEFFKRKMLSIRVSFQGKNETVGRLVGPKPEDVLDSLEELLRPGGGQIIIPSFDSTRFEKSLYIRRRVKFAFHGRFVADLAKRLKCTVEKLNGECRISSQGQIEWLGDTDLERRNKIWENIKQMNDQTSGKIEEDSHLIQLDEEPTEHPVVIICGVAGTGKSTLLSHFYSEIKKKKPGCWIIRLNLVEHCDAILKLDRSRPDFIGFLINHLHVIDSKCPFSCSLLNHRLETGEQIVFMFDGYDEIGKKHQNIAVQLMKIIQKKKGIQLYVTTRTHMAYHLQNELCQLAYYLENFSEADQINYLAKYWTKELKLRDGVREGAIKEFAKSLVAQVSESLKDEERAFIGIPLQSRILAECYQQKVGDIVQNNNRQSDKLLSKKLLALLDDQKFDLVSLYSQLMVTKRNIFLQEKSQAGSNPNVEFAMKSTIKIIDLRLTKLAVETIVTEPNVLKMFWPTEFSDESSDDVVQEGSHSLNYGLTFSNGEGMRPQFLHRTFAEYFVAKYFYEGFRLDDKRHNKLLGSESVRQLILNEILATEQYDGVQVFFDGMVKTLVDEDQEWRYKINHRQLPDRLTKLAENLFTQFLRNNPPCWELDNMIRIKLYFANALHFSLSNGKGNIFLLLCDCLDATFERKQIHRAMYASFIPQYRYFSTTFFKESKLFKRFINYFDIDPNDPSTYSVIDKLIGGIDAKSPLWNRDGHQQTMKDLLQFLENQHVAFGKYLIQKRDLGIQQILEFFICHDNYRCLLERFLKFLSKTKAYSDDFKFAKLLMKVFVSKEQMMSGGQIASTLKILHELGRSTLLAQLYSGVLSKEPEAFQNIYQPCRLEKEEAMSTDLDTLLERDDYGMTLLHGAAFYGNVDIVEQILARFRQPELDDGAKQQVNKVLLEANTPFYFAAAKNHKEVCSKLLAFVKDIFPESPLNESIYRSLEHALESHNVEIFQLILKVVKKELGHACLVHLVTTTSSFSTESIFCKGSRSENIFNAMAKIVVVRDGVVDYKILHDLIFNKNRIATDALRRMDVEHLQGLLSVESAGPFTKRLLTDDQFLLCWNLLTSDLLRNFNETQLLDFVEVLTHKKDAKTVKRSRSITVSTVLLSDPTYHDMSIQHLLRHYPLSDLIFTPNGDGTTTVHAKRNVPRNSFWGDFLRSTATSLVGSYIYGQQIRSIFACLHCVSDKLGRDWAKELLLHQDNRGYVVLHLSPEIVKLMLSYLPEKNQEEIKKEWKENTPPMTHDSFINQDSTRELPSSATAIIYSNILRFYLVYGSEMQLSNCVDILTSIRLIDGQQRSVWSDIFEHCEVTTTNEILKSVSGMFGWEAVEKLLCHEVDGFPLLLKAASWGDDIDGRLDMLPQEIRNVIQQIIEQRADEFIDEVLEHHETYFGGLGDPIYKRLNVLIFLIKYSNEEQLEQFVENITQLRVSRRRLSIWADMLTHPCDESKTNNVEKMNIFLKCVWEKLDTNAVKELVLHEIEDEPVIHYLAVRGEEKMVEAMLAHLDAKNRKKIQRQVDEFLDKTFQVPKVHDAPHGLKLESNFLTLFCIRALGAGYKFEVTKEREDLGGVTFRYLVPDETSECKHWRYRYLQAKHKENENEKINAAHLLGDNERSDFSLPKYFRSFCKMRTRGEDIQDCIICTNIGFDVKDVQKKSIELLPISDHSEDILVFGPQEKKRGKTAHYKLKFTEELRRKALKDWPDIRRLAEKLQECAQGEKTASIKTGVFRSYHVALINERVIDLKTEKFHEDFVNEAENLSDGAKQLRQIVIEQANKSAWENWEFHLHNNFGKSRWGTEKENRLPLKVVDADIDAFLDKFVFVVNMSNEDYFEEILQTKEVSKYYPEEECKKQTIRLLKEIPNFWYKTMGDWITSEEAKEILLDGVTAASQHYQEELKRNVGFDEIPSDKMTDKLKRLLANGNRIERIFIPSPKHKAVEVLSAIKNVPEYTRDKSFLMVTLSSLNDEERWTNILKLKTNSHHLLVVVCDKETPDPCGCEELVPVDQTVNKIVFIYHGDITYAELSENFQKDILEKTISFQGTKLTVNELVGNEPDKVIGHLSIQELLFQEEKVVNIPQSDTSAYEESLYMTRRLMTAFNESFETKLTNRLNCTLDELHEKCKFTAQGEIKWFVKEADRQSIWLAIKRLTDEEVSSNAIDESQLIRLDEGSERSPVVIISDGAGTGKSTLLSHYYMGMKRAKPDHWIIRTNLAEHQTALAQLETTAEDDAIDFLCNKLHIVANDSPFSRSLLRHRIKTGKRIAFMFDGFDEISNVCQQKLIHLMKILADKETIGLYVTTRPHMVDELQSGLFQLAHHLQILSEEDRLNYLINYWQENLHEVEQENKSIIIRKFAEALAQRISETLKLEEMCFIGVPLQCRILAEYYQYEVGKRIEDDKVGECVTLEDQDFDLKGLYGRLLRTKRRIFQEEKGKSPTFNNTKRETMHISILTIEFHLTKLAVKTLVANEGKANILWPFQHPHELSDNEKDLTDSGVKYGLVLRSKCEETSYVQFVHRTYAEYLFARYLHQEMDINNVANYRLFDEKPICDLVINEILIQDNYHGVRVFLNSMLTKTENDQRTNPTDLLKKFATHLAKHIHLSRRYRIHPHGNTLIVALQTEHLFHFLLDCLDGTLDESEAKRVVTFAFEQPFDFSIFLHLGEKPRYLSDFCKLFHSVKGNDKVLKRILSYYGDADVVDGKGIVKQLYQNLFVSRIFSSNYVYLRNNDKAKHVLNTTLDFVENHTLHLKLALDLEQPPFGPLDMSVILLHFYIFNEDDSNVLVKFLRILSSIYSEDNKFTELIKCALNMQANNEDKVNYPSGNGIEKTLDVLRELSRPTVMQGLFHLALVTNLFEKYYLPDQDSLVDPPPRMTALHWAAFNGDLEAIESMGHETCNADDGFTPFYVAAARHQEEFCNKILSLLKTRWNATDNELRKHLTNDKGFVFTAMWDAVCFENVKMFQVILKSVKQALGRNYLMDLLKSKKSIESFASQVYDGQDTLLLALKTGIDRKMLFKTIAKVLLEDGGQEGYTNLNDLVFQSKETFKTVNYIEEETLHGMMNVNGQDMWRQRFMDCDRHWGFTLLSSSEWGNLELRFRSLQTSL